MTVSFGKTWWGEHWLRSLDNIDYDNRLPRGASYARSGHVREIKIKGNTVSARVAGSRPSPYQVKIIIPPFFEDQIARLMNEIIARPALISGLLNRELGPGILPVAEDLGLRVFPRQWADFKMLCSCPDWAVPCKHLASVIYMISREIDNNPFLVFELHQVNLLSELKKRGILIPDIRKAEVPEFANLLEVNENAPSAFNAESAYNRVDFSLLQNIAGAMVRVLPDAPPFYPGGNFRNLYEDQLVRIGRDAGRLLNRKLHIDKVLGLTSDVSPLTSRSTLYLTLDADRVLKVHGGEHAMKDMGQLIHTLFQINPGHLPDYQPSVAAFWQLLQASLHLLANGAVVPQIVQLENKRFAIRWLPAMIDSRVKAVASKLSEIVPPGTLLAPVMERKKIQYRELENPALELLSAFLTEGITRLSKPADSDIFINLFFGNSPYGFTGVGENALSGGIKVWLDRYFFTGDTYKPVIIVNDTDNERFDVTVSVEDTRTPTELPIPLSDILTLTKFERERFRILRGMSLLTPFITGLDTYINEAGIRPVVFSNADFAPFLMEVLPAIRLLDIRILLPKALQDLLRPKPTVRLTRRDTSRQGFIRLEQLLAFDWQVAIGDQVMAPEEFNRLMNQAGGLIRFKEQYMYVSDADLEKLHRAMTRNKPLNSFQLLHTALSGDFEGAPVVLSPEVHQLIIELTSEDSIPLPAGLLATLRPYQVRGYSWMYKNSRIGFGSMLADDMGLGKTLQVITLLLRYKEEKVLSNKHRALVVVPTGLLTNWQTEIQKFAPGLTTGIHHGTSRDLGQFDSDVLLTTYGMVRSDHEELRKMKWQVVIIDEAQNIKNQTTAQSKAVKSLGASMNIALSGTPVENRLSEFWSIMDFTNKGYLGNEQSFDEEFGRPIQVYQDEKAVHRFKKVTAPFLMRRMKSDKSIISDLPDKIEQNQYAVLTRPQAALYEKTMLAALNEIEGISGTNPQTLFKRQGLVLQMILALKQICNHPTHFLKNGKTDPSLSGKMDLLFELLQSIVDSQEKVLIFTQFREMGDLLQQFIAAKFGDRPMFYHGGCSVVQRKEMVDRFQNNRADKIFILSLKAAGTGLNLTAASHVIHYDLWWNPAVEAQATDRAYRIGQHKNVMVHRIITRNTFEERIDEMIRQKKHLADLTVTAGESWIGKLSNKELREIFS